MTHDATHFLDVDLCIFNKCIGESSCLVASDRWKRSEQVIWKFLLATSSARNVSNSFLILLARARLTNRIRPVLFFYSAFEIFCFLWGWLKIRSLTFSRVSFSTSEISEIKSFKPPGKLNSDKLFCALYHQEYIWNFLLLNECILNLVIVTNIPIIVFYNWWPLCISLELLDAMTLATGRHCYCENSHWLYCFLAAQMKDELILIIRGVDIAVLLICCRYCQLFLV